MFRKIVMCCKKNFFADFTRELQTRNEPLGYLLFVHIIVSYLMELLMQVSFYTFTWIESISKLSCNLKKTHLSLFCPVWYHKLTKEYKGNINSCALGKKLCQEICSVWSLIYSIVKLPVNVFFTREVVQKKDFFWRKLKADHGENKVQCDPTYKP